MQRCHSEDVYKQFLSKSLGQIISLAAYCPIVGGEILQFGMDDRVRFGYM